MEAKYNMIIELAQQQGLTHIQLTQKHCLHLATSVGKLCYGVANNAEQHIKLAAGEIFTLLTIINHQIRFDEDSELHTWKAGGSNPPERRATTILHYTSQFIWLAPWLVDSNEKEQNQNTIRINLFNKCSGILIELNGILKEYELTLDECLDEFLKNKHCLNEFSIHKE
ncbi:TPA: hypothetical protein PWU90_002458 [Mannheimia haemolytica]|uniref:hypothetical protein n=1 Tax=Mannheimia haemolytica TaxID=75985 RepID=UPI001E3C80D5|nr:hypothetical protein [Mannheimia haemolytica]UFK42081.1 hypothetical protein LO774_10200 [Mannheimia haemolytica]HDL1114148.1 hypothetical protein [Mannheimia haemolytica]HDL1116587.1 hypothetical protein [Mannheimia haemolytica]HDL1124883.1 hypothetical protein [Mannheimia haemolytica]HDL1127283.1 hypothetical protein [Mannheimia haemolytica]